MVHRSLLRLATRPVAKRARILRGEGTIETPAGLASVWRREINEKGTKSVEKMGHWSISNLIGGQYQYHWNISSGKLT